MTDPFCFPRHFAGASLKLFRSFWKGGRGSPFSPAFRWGLIEAGRLYSSRSEAFRFSPAFRWGLIEAPTPSEAFRSPGMFSPAFRWGLIEAKEL